MQKTYGVNIVLDFVAKEQIGGPVYELMTNKILATERELFSELDIVELSLQLIFARTIQSIRYQHMRKLTNIRSVMPPAFYVIGMMMLARAAMSFTLILGHSLVISGIGFTLTNMFFMVHIEREVNAFFWSLVEHKQHTYYARIKMSIQTCNKMLFFLALLCFFCWQQGY